MHGKTTAPSNFLMESGNTNSYRYDLLECLEKLVHCERQLTAALTRVLPLVSSEETDYKLATPKSMDQVKEILAYARTLSTRTSAPCGWNPSLPLIGFATPNPLPHQIRGGCLGVLQLQQVKQEQSRSLKSSSKGTDKSMISGDQKGAKTELSSAKLANTEELAVAKAQRKDRAIQRAADEERRKKKVREAEEAKQRLTMNLSESSSSSESEDDSDDEE